SQRKLRTANGYSGCRPKMIGPLLPDRAARAISHRGSADANRNEATKWARSYWASCGTGIARAVRADHNMLKCMPRASEASEGLLPEHWRHFSWKRVPLRFAA